MSRTHSIVALFVFLAFLSSGAGAQPQPGTQPAPDEFQLLINRMAEQYHLGPPASNEQRATLVTARETGTKAYWQRFPYGSIYVFQGEGRTEVGGIFLVHGTINSTYIQLQYHDSRLGFPTSNEIACSSPDTRDRFQRFERGIMYWRAATNIARPYYGKPDAWPDNRCDPNTAESRTPETPRTNFPLYRVTLLGFQCDEQTDDDILERDGRGDEVYLLVHTAKYNRSGVPEETHRYRTVLMGANLHRVDQNRLVLGNLGEDGGIGNGFRYLPARNPVARYNGLTLPMVVYEGRIDEGTALMIVPTIWEWDGPDDNLQSFDYHIENTWFKGADTRNFVRVAIEHGIDQAINEAYGPGPIFSTASRLTTCLLCTLGDKQGGDRPIGTWVRPGEWGSYLEFSASYLFLTAANATRVAGTPGSLPRLGEDTPRRSVEALYDARFLEGLLSVQYANGGKGKYWLFLKVEKLS